MSVTATKILIVSVFVLCYIGCCSSVGRRRLYNGYDCPRGSPKHILIECNFCKCKDGHLVNCSHYICTKDGYIATGNEQTCIEKEVKYDKCGVCLCRNDTWYCTESRCRNTTRSKRSFWESLCIFAGIQTATDDDCIGCRSTRDAQPDSCVPADDDVKYVPFFAEDLKDVSCAPHDELVLDCFICVCNPNSIGYTCTLADDCNENYPIDQKVRSARMYLNSKIDEENNTI